jgi:hypothetical protein
MSEEDEKMKKSEHTTTVIDEMKHIDHFIGAGATGTGAGPGGHSGISGSNKWRGKCDVGRHPEWTGPFRAKYEEAMTDCAAHNESCDAKGAIVTDFG